MHPPASFPDSTLSPVLPDELEPCPQCGAALDMAGLEALTAVACPVCTGEIIARRHLDHFRLDEVAGRGGMGVVYKATDLSLNRPVALKLLRKDRVSAAALEQLETEAATTASINHPHVVKVFSTGSDTGRFYLAMELVSNGTLDDLIRIQGRVAETQALEIGLQIAQGLQAAHLHGLIHRDVKPGNILFADAHTAKIVDFGLAMLEQEAAEGSGEVWGTPYYVAPEKLDNKPEDFRSDMYSLGATLFHALAGRPPFEAASATLVALKHLKNQPVSLQAFAPHVSATTAYVINRTLSKNPAERYASWDEMIEHLEYARTQVREGAAASSGKARVRVETEDDLKRWSLLVCGIMALIVLAGTGFWWASRSAGNPSVRVSAQAAPVATPAYERGRALLLDGKAAEAGKVFRAVAADRATSQTHAQWALLQAGIAHTVAGLPLEARTDFTALAKAERSARAPSELALASFFAEAGRRALEGSTASVAATNALPASDTAAMAGLAWGLAAWHRGDWEGGGALLRQFTSALPRSATWMREYKPLVQDYLNDLTELRNARDLAAAPHAPNSKSDSLARVRAMSGQVKTGDVAKAAMAGFVAGLEKAAADRARGAADEADNDLAALRAAGDRGSAARSLWDFDAARHELSKVPLVTDGARRALNGVGLKLEWLKRFRDTLVEDLNAAPARSLLAEGAQPPLLLTSASATGKALDVAGRTVPWSTVAPTSVLKTAAAFAKLQTTDEARVERQWLLGVYALMSGQTAEAESLLMAASVLRADLRAALPLLLPARRASGGAAASFFEPADWFMSPEFTSLDLGNVGLAGRTDSPPGLGQHTITAAGADIWGTADGCRFLHAPLRGDFEITVRVTRFESTHEWGKAGIMVRESLAPGARNVFFCLSGSKGVTANQRAETGADVNAICESADLQAGCWLRLTRRGEEWTVFNSLDGSAWKWQGKVNLALPAEVFAGLAVSSHDTNYLATATFDFVQAKCIVPVR